jgi:hypothetical protein
VGGWLAPERLQHINAGALKIYANGIGMLKIYFLEYRKSTIDSPSGKSHPSKNTAKNSGVFESAQNKIVSQKQCQVDRGKNGWNDLQYCIRSSRIAFVAREAHGATDP